MEPKKQLLKTIEYATKRIPELFEKTELIEVGEPDTHAWVKYYEDSFPKNKSQRFETKSAYQKYLIRKNDNIEIDRQVSLFNDIEPLVRKMHANPFSFIEMRRYFVLLVPVHSIIKERVLDPGYKLTYEQFTFDVEESLSDILYSDFHDVDPEVFRKVEDAFLEKRNSIEKFTFF